MSQLRLPASNPSSPGESSGSGQALFALGVACGLLAALALDRAARSYLDRDLEFFRTVREFALEEYVEEVHPDQLLDDALDGMLFALDKNSRFYGQDQLGALDRETTGEFLGIGVVFRTGEPGRILFPYPGSPAEKAGLRVGDRIVTARGESVLAADELQTLLHGGSGDVPLGIEGLEGERRDVVLHPEVVLDPTVRHARFLDPRNGLGYLAIRSFSHRTPEEFDQVVAELQQHGLRGLVIDLRANPGGILDAAVVIANRFVAHGALVATRTRTETLVRQARPEDATLAGLPLVVLIDRASASASEVLAAALQDQAVAVLVGEPSYGKGTVQTLKRLEGDRGVVKLTTAHYCSPSLRRIEHDDGDAEHSGIAPDLWVPIDEGVRDEILRFLFSYSPPESALEALRAWEEREQTKLLAAPPPDPQLDAAIGLLARAMNSLTTTPRVQAGLVLGIESSCDETAAAVVREGREILSSVVRSQIEEHAPFRGVVPEIAGRSHLRAVLEVIDEALERADTSLDRIDAIAVTYRPGLIGSLLVGLSSAKALAFAQGLPLIAVNHIEAHAYAAAMEHELEYPLIALVVSGGHTALYRMDSPCSLVPLAETLDDAAGEAFDKVASMLGLPYPGGPAIGELALAGRADAFRLPRFSPRGGGVGFSFSGLKTAVLYSLRGQDASAPPPAPQAIPRRADLAASFQEAVVDVLVAQSLAAACRARLATITVTGGVACNARLRQRMTAAGAEHDLRVVFPSPSYCTDNAAMIAGQGWHLFREGRIAPWDLDAVAH